MKNKILLVLLLFGMVLVSQVISAASSYPITVRPKIDGLLQPDAYFEYVFNFTTDLGCTTVLSSKSAGITTDAYGIGYTELDLSDLTQAPSYLCEYRNDSLRKVHNISIGMFDDALIKNITLSEKITFAFGEIIDNIIDGFIRIGGSLNVTGLIYGNGSQLTDVVSQDTSWLANWTAYNSSWSSITNTSYYLITNPSNYWNDTYATFNETYADTLYSTIDEPSWTGNYTAYNSTWSTDTWDTTWLANYTAYNDSWSNVTNLSYVPYTGATQNVDLGANNFTVNTNSFFVDSSSGNVGIGTTSPGEKLHVNGSVNVTSGNDVCIEGGNCLSSVSGGSAIWTNSSGNATFTSGNVGIGTSSPEKLLHINTSGGNELQYALKLQNPDNTDGGGTATGILFKISSADGINSKAGIAFERRVSSGRGHIRFLQNSIDDGTEANLNNTVVTINKDGNLGIGNYTQSISSPLTISRDGSGGGLIKIEDTQTNGQSLYINNGWSGAGGPGMAGFYFKDKQIMTFNSSSGYVGIGTITPQNTLNVVGDGNFTENVTASYFVGDGSLLTGISGGLWTNSSGNATFISGNVGIGTSSPDMKLEIEGTTSDTPATSGTSQNGSLRLSNSGNNLVLDFGQTSSSPWGTWIQSTDKTNLTIGYNLILNPNGGSLIIDGSNVITDKVQGSVNNINFGPSTLQKITALGLKNVAIGFQAMEENTDGDENTAVGYWALRKNTVGIDNTAFGRGALHSSITGNNSVAVGKSTGFYFTGTQGTFLGSLAGSDANNGSGNIMIGYNVQPSTSVVSNELNIGDIIYGNLSSGYVGIGTISPTQKLDVRDGAIRVGYDSDTFDQLVEFWRNGVKIGAIDNSGSDVRLKALNSNDVLIIDDDNNGLIVKEGGNVGIGIINPSSKLDIYGGNITLSNSTASELNYFKFGRGGYIYDNGTAIIIGHY